MRTKGMKKLSKALAIFMTVFMLMGMMPQAAFADEVPADDSIIQQEQQLDDAEQNIDDPVEEQKEQQQQSELDKSNVPVVTSEEPSQETASGTVYMSVSYDGQYINDKDGGYIAYVPVSLSAVSSVNLDEYGLDEYNYDEDGDGTYDITALHLVIYAHENIYGGSWDDVTFTGSPGSSYFEGGIFGFDENLNYYVNGQYPLASAGWGATSDQIVLEAGDFVDIASFSSWNFYSDSNYGFHFFADGNDTFTHDYSAEAGKEANVKLVRSYSGMGSAATVYDEPYYTVSYGTSLYDAAGTVTTDDLGYANITFPTAGTWYIWADGGYGMEYPDDIVSSPAFAKVVVNEAENPDQEAADEVINKIDAIGDNITLDSESAIVEARTAYDALTDAQKALVTNACLAKLATAEAALAALKTPATTEFVYISVSYDGRYVGANHGAGAPMAYVPVSLSAVSSVNLDDYELSDYKYDEDGDGTYEITALQLIIYAHENLYGGDWSDVTFTGYPGSSYFQGGVFGFDENLNYYLNGQYPLVSAGWGATSDQIVLEAGDYIDMASFSSWDFFADSNYGFHFFADENGTFTHDYTVEAGAELPIKLVRSYSSMGSGASVLDEAGYEIYYGENLYRETDSVTTDESGCANITFPSAGTWYLWADGGWGLEYSDSIVSAPAYAKVTVTAVEEPASEPVDEVENKINAIGEVTLDSEDVIKEAREAYEKLTGAQKALVENYSVLEAAESTLDGLKSAAAAADQAAANAVIALIEAIGTVDVHSGSKVNSAREGYDALTDSQKALVTNDDKLTAAEKELGDLYEAAANTDHKAIYETTGKYIAGLGTPSVGSTGGEWMVIDITRAGGSCPEGYYDNVIAFVKENINDKEQLHGSKSTDNSRVILGLTSAGYDVTDVAGHNLLKGLTDMSYVKKQGVNGPIWALIAFDSNKYDIPVNPDAEKQVTREGLIEYILSKQLTDGGWALTGRVADPDITGMALQALAPYYNTDKTVKAAVDEAINTLSQKQLDNGGFGSIDGACTESCAQVIVALTALGINPETDERFVKNGMSVVDAMCTFAVEGGGFAHVPNGRLNGMATEQGQYALAAYYRMLDGKTSLYDMTDVAIKTNPEAGDSNGGTTSDSNKEENKTQQSGNKTTTKTITKSANVKLANTTVTEEQLAQGKENHYCEETGVDARDNSNDILPWYIKLNVVKQEITDDQKAKVSEALGGEGEVFILKDIHFINTKDGSEWQPTKPVKIKIPMVDIGDYENAIIVHITDDGKIELIKGTVKDGMIEFEADSFSLYGIAGTNTSINDLLGVEDDGAVVWPWIVIAIIALAATAYLVYRRKREA